MKCSCGVDNLSSAKFCKGCGSKIETGNSVQTEQKSCPSCQASLKADSKFCNKCGYNFSEKAKELIAEPNIEQTVNVTQPVAPEELSKTCASCGAKVKANAKFCGSCGKSPDAPPVNAAVEPAPVISSEPVEEPVVANTPIETPPAKKKTTEATLAEPQPNTVKPVVASSTGSNKKMIVISGVLLAVIGSSIAAWFALKAPEKVPPVVKTESTPTATIEPQNTTAESVVQPVGNTENTAKQPAESSNNQTVKQPEIPATKNEEVKKVEPAKTEAAKPVTPKKTVVKRTKLEAKDSSVEKPVPQKTEPQPEPQQAPVAEPVQSEQQETTAQDEPKKKRKKGVGGFFEKLGESVKQGATESECTSAQRAMSQCN
jgi:hypothetical protein